MFSISIHPTQRLAVIRFSGPVDTEQAAECIRRFAGLPDYDPGLNGVVDLRGALVTVSAEQAKGLARQSLERELSMGKWAFLAETPMNTALALLYADVLAKRHESRIFSTVEAAADYLGVDIEPLLSSR